MRRDYPGHEAPTYSCLQSSERLRVSLERFDKCMLNLPYYFIVAPGAIINRISLSHFTIYQFTPVYMNIIDLYVFIFESSISAPLLVLSSTLQVSPTGRMCHSLTCNLFTSNYFPICRYPNARFKINEHWRQRSPSVS